MAFSRNSQTSLQFSSENVVEMKKQEGISRTIFFMKSQVGLKMYSKEKKRSQERIGIWKDEKKGLFIAIAF